MFQNIETKSFKDLWFLKGYFQEVIAFSSTLQQRLYDTAFI